jgi:hypothetical protein
MTQSFEYKGHKVVKSYDKKRDGSGICKKPSWDVMLNGEFIPMGFATKKQAQAYIDRKQGKTLCEIIDAEEGK